MFITTHQPVLSGALMWSYDPAAAASSTLLSGRLAEHLPATNPLFPRPAPAASDGATQLLSVLGAVTAAQSAVGAGAHSRAGIAGVAPTLQHLCPPSAAVAAVREQAAARPAGSAFKPLASGSQGTQDAAPAGPAGTAGAMLIRPVARRPSAPLPLAPVSPERVPSCPSGTTVTATAMPADASPRSCSSTLDSRPSRSASRGQRHTKRKRKPRPAEQPATHVQKRVRAATATGLPQDGISPMGSPKGEPQLSASSSGRGSNASAATVAACASHSTAPSPAQVTWAVQMYAQHYELRQKAAAAGTALPELPPEVTAILSARLRAQMQS